jgi:hypothetical protein
MPNGEISLRPSREDDCRLLKLPKPSASGGLV